MDENNRISDPIINHFSYYFTKLISLLLLRYDLGTFYSALFGKILIRVEHNKTWIMRAFFKLVFYETRRQEFLSFQLLATKKGQPTKHTVNQHIGHHVC